MYMESLDVSMYRIIRLAFYRACIEGESVCTRLCICACIHTAHANMHTYCTRKHAYTHIYRTREYVKSERVMCAGARAIT